MLPRERSFGTTRFSFFSVGLMALIPNETFLLASGLLVVVLTLEAIRRFGKFEPGEKDRWLWVMGLCLCLGTLGALLSQLLWVFL